MGRTTLEEHVEDVSTDSEHMGSMDVAYGQLRILASVPNGAKKTAESMALRGVHAGPDC